MSTLRQRITDLEDSRHVTELHLRASLDAARQTEYQLSEERWRLQRALDDVAVQLTETETRASASDGRVVALLAQLAQV